MRVHDPYAAFRSSGFQAAFGCHIFTIFAAQIQTTTIGWLLYERTGSAAVLGLVGLTVFVPVFLLALPVGFFVDFHSRKTLLMGGVTMLASSVLLMAFLAYIHAPVPFFFVALTIIGIANTIVSISRPVLMRDVVQQHHAENASNWSSFGRRVSSVLGPILAGNTIAFSGAPSAFFIAALFYAIGLLCAQLIPSSPLQEGGPLTMQELFKGIHFMKRNPLVLSATLLDLCAALLGGITGLMPIFARDILHVGPIGLGLLTAAPSLGSGFMSFFLAHRPPLKRAGKTLLLAVGVYGFMTVLFGLSENVLLSIAALFVVGAADAISVTVRGTILQVFVPPHLRGRVYGVNTIFIYSSNELGDFESGMLAALTSAPVSVLTGGTAAMILAGIFAWKAKKLRSLGMMAV
jgi:MFS family permease